MRDYGKVYTSFWTSKSINALSDDGQKLALYLLTSPHSTLAGVYHLPAGYACIDLRWTRERFLRTFEELRANEFAIFCENTEWVWVAHHDKFNPVDNPNQLKAVAKIALSIPAECAWKPYFMRVRGHALGITANPSETVSKPFRNPFETLSKPLSNPSEMVAEPIPNGYETPSKPEAVTGTETEAETERQPPAQNANANSQNLIAQSALAGTAEPATPKRKPRTNGHHHPAADDALQAACRATLAAYSAAYLDRYSTTPVRNARVASQVKAFCQRVPMDHAPEVAAFFVGHSDAFYVRKGHAFGMLLSDAEKLHTEWATGKRVTATSAQQQDRTQANGDVWRKLIEEAEADERGSHGPH